MKDKMNAYVRCEQKDKYTNLYVSFKDKEGKDIDLLVMPVCRDKKSLAKLMYKIRMALSE